MRNITKNCMKVGVSLLALAFSSGVLAQYERYSSQKQNQLPQRTCITELGAKKEGGLTPKKIHASKSDKRQIKEYSEDGLTSSKIYANIYYTKSWEDAIEYDKYGIYSFPMNSQVAIYEPWSTGSLYECNAGSVMANGVYWVNFYNPEFNNFEHYGIADFKNTYSGFLYRKGDDTTMATDMTFDSTSSTVYGCFYNDIDGNDYFFGKIDYSPKPAVSTPIKQLGSSSWMALACDRKGQLYALEADGTLLKVNKTTGDTEIIGETGLTTSYATTGEIDPNTGVFYFASSAAGKEGMYKIDLTTASATLLYSFTDGELLSGMFIPEADIAESAPGTIENLEVNFAFGSKEGNVSFTMPTKLMDGSTGNGSLTWHIKVGGNEVATGTAQFGESVSTKVTVNEEGLQDVAVYASNGYGNGPESIASVFIGNDAPDKVKNISLLYDYSKNAFNLSWSPVVMTQHGTTISNVTYDVKRMPDNKVVASSISATSLTDNVSLPQNDYVGYYYEITSKYGSVSGISTSSYTWVLGNVETPFTDNFNSASAMNKYIRYDVSGDGATWEYSNGKIRAGYSWERPMDDWFILPPLYLEAGNIYPFSFVASNQADEEDTVTEYMDVWIGENPMIESLKTPIFNTFTVNNPNGTTKSTYIEVDKDGYYFIGFHACTPMFPAYLYIDDINVGNIISNNAPASPSLSISPDSFGNLEATVFVTAPNKTIGGESLSAISKIIVECNGEKVHEFTNPQPGETQSCKVSVRYAGAYTFSAIAYGSDGKPGTPVDKKSYVGMNIPTAPANVKIEETDEGEVTITWDKPERDINGYEWGIDDSLMRYMIVDMYNGLVEMDIEDNFCTFQAINKGRQDFLYYKVYAGTIDGYNENTFASTEMIAVGTPFNMPWAESLSNGVMSNLWGVYTPSSIAAWMYGDDSEFPGSQDNDNGYFCFAAQWYDTTARLMTGKINITGEAPTLSLYVWAEPNSYNSLRILINTGEGFKTVRTVTLNEFGTQGWERVEIPLTQYKGSFVQVGFEGDAVTDNCVYMDNLRIYNRPDTDLSAFAITSDGHYVTAGEPVEFSIQVMNQGAKDVDSWSLDLVRDDEVVATIEKGKIKAGEVQVVKLTDTPSVTLGTSVNYYGKVTVNADGDNSNDKSNAYVINILSPNVPMPTNLIGESTDSEVELKWEAPVYDSSETIEITDGVEGYYPFSIGLATTQEINDYIGDWAMIDISGTDTYGITSASGYAITYPNAEKPMAFIVFNNDLAGVTSADWKGHGNSEQYFAAFSDTDKENNDWLISPELSGEKQTVSFFARSQTGYSDAFEFLYSTAGKSTADFVLVQKVTKVPSAWTEYKMEIPEGAKYFAIRCVSQDQWAFLVDDITYRAQNPFYGIKFIGYNVYRNNEKLTGNPITATSYKTTRRKSGDAYKVTAVFDSGESSPLVYNTDPSGVELIGNDGVVISSGHGLITVKAPSASDMSVFSIDGVKLGSRSNIEEATFSVVSGIYVVSVNERNYKVIVR